jgi:hypothetical protein
MDVRLGGTYALEQLAKDSDKYRETIFEVLAAFVRQRDLRIDQGRLVKDVQAAATVLGRRAWRVEDRALDLSGADLGPADLVDAKLAGANLAGANLQGANLSGAKLGGAILVNANIEGANLSGANIEGANLSGSNLQGTVLALANLEPPRVSRGPFWLVSSFQSIGPSGTLAS